MDGERTSGEAEALARVRTLAHELNNHLTAIRLTTELCETKLDDGARVARGLREIRELAEQATRSTNELLRLGRTAAS